MADLRWPLERQMLASEAQRRDVVEKISVTEAEAHVHYEANKKEFTTPSEVTLRGIYIEVLALACRCEHRDVARADVEVYRQPHLLRLRPERVPVRVGERREAENPRSAGNTTPR